MTCAGGLIGVGLTAEFAIGLAFLADARRRGAFFGAFFLIVLVLLANVVFFRVAAFVPGVFLRFFVDQIVYSRPFLRAEIEDRVFVSFKTMRYPQIIVIFIAKTPCDRRRCDGKNQPSHSRECC